MAGRREALIAGQYSGGFICDPDNATFTLVGKTSPGNYSIYDYRYRFMATSVMHGGQRIMVFRGPDYLGQYSLSPPPLADVSVDGSRVVVQTGDAPEKAVLDFSGGPPKQVFIDGYILDFYR